MLSTVSQTLTHTFRNRILQSSHRTAFKRKIKGIWEDISYQEYYNFVQEICFSLKENGIGRGDRVAILSNSRIEWAFSDLAILSCCAITVPIYQSSIPSEVEYILQDSQAKAIFVEDTIQLEKVLSIQKNLPHLKTIVIFQQSASPKTSTIPIFSIEEFCQKGLQYKNQNLDAHKFFDKLLQENKPEDPATIVYTSGTTGVPKGVVLTHENFISELSDITSSFELSDKDIILSFLPFAHIFARIELYCGLAFGWTHAFAEGIPQLVDNLAEIRPTFMFAVPRIYEKVYNKIIAQVNEGSSLKKKIFFWSLRIGKKVSEKNQHRQALTPLLKIQNWIAAQLVFKKLQQKFGGRIRFFISGGAPLSGEIARFFHAAGFLILEGYGLTETSAAITINRENDYVFGSIGAPLGDVQIKIAQDGEILVKSKKVFKEYYKNQKATQETFQDGWYCTGDIGYRGPHGHLYITDRKKDIIVTSGGKNIAPQKIENMLKTNPYITQAMIYGDKQRYLSALIVLNQEEVIKYAHTQGINGKTTAHLSHHPVIEKLVSNAINNVNKALASFETIKKFRILENEFTIETGELTPSLKVKRKYCTEKFKDIIQSMYE